MTGQGPLSGIRVLEFAGLGPVPFCGMLLSDMGADIVRVERAGYVNLTDPVTERGRSSIELDLKTETGRDLARVAMRKADVVIEGYRPGVMERLGLGPDWALEQNPGLVYGRVTGWGREGPFADRAGHDITYIALTGALDEIGHADRPPVPPLNLVGDFGGGALFLAYGIAVALFERSRSGLGQVVDAAILDGTASLMASFLGMRDLIGAGRGRNHLGGASPTYRCYTCADGRHIAIGAIEEPFWDALADALGLTEEERARGPGNAALTECLTQLFRSAPRAEWERRLSGRNICAAPVLSLEEATDHPHLRARGTYRRLYGQVHPAPTPRLSRTPGVIAGPPSGRGEGGRERLGDWGVPPL